MSAPAHQHETDARLLEPRSLSPRLALQLCMHQLVQTQLSSLACAGAAAADKPAALTKRLEQLQYFLGDSDSGHTREFGAAPTRNHAFPPGVPEPLVKLLNWQLCLERAELCADAPGLSLAAVLLRPLLQQQLEAIGRLCASSAWTLAYFSTAGLAQHWHYAVELALFCPEQGAAAPIARLQANCLHLHLQGVFPEASCRSALLAEIASRAANPFAAGRDPGPPALACPVGMEGLFATELNRYRQLLDGLLAAPATPLVPAGQLLTALYKLAWVTDACRPGVLALAWRCAYQLSSECQFHHRALPESVIEVLKKLLSLPDTGIEADPADQCLRQWQTQMLRQWPVDGPSGSLPIVLASPASDAARVVRLEAVPLLLADSFSTLVRVSRDWFDANAANTPEFDALLQQLALLEKGAAAVKVWPLEQLCTLLLEVYATVEREGAALPVTLLASAHAGLVRLLDQAAAWQQTSVDGAITGDLQRWIGQAAERRPVLSISAPTPAEAAAAQLYQALLVYLTTLTLVVEKPVRLHVDPDNAVLPPQAVLQVADALKPLLRFVLLDNTSAAYTRRAAHKPMVHTISIHLRMEAGRLRVMLAEDNEGPLLTPAQTRELQRRLPVSAGPLDCELHHGQGRWFSFTLAEVAG